MNTTIGGWAVGSGSDRPLPSQVWPREVRPRREGHPSRGGGAGAVQLQVGGRVHAAVVHRPGEEMEEAEGGRRGGGGGGGGGGESLESLLPFNVLAEIKLKTVAKRKRVAKTPLEKV